MLTNDDLESADTLRFTRVDLDVALHPDATGIYDISSMPAARYVGHSTIATRSSTRRRRKIRETRENLVRLHEAVAAGWDVGHELAHEERRLVTLEAAS
jgi:hypothetical protein